MEVALNELKWIDMELKMKIASNDCHNRDMIEELERAYRTSEEVEGIKFHLVKEDEQPCDYDTNKFIIFYNDIIDRLRIGPPFTFFQVEVLNALGVTSW